MQWLLWLLQFLPESTRLSILLILRDLGFTVVAQTRIAKGTNSSKAATASLAINDVSMDAGTVIVVGVVFFAAANNPTVFWGNKKLTRDKTNEEPNSGIRTQLYRGRVKNTKSRDVVLTWGTSTPGARAAFVSEITEASLEDVSVVNDNLNSTTPNTSSAGTSTEAATISIACFGSNGPSGDTAATGTTQGHTLGQRIGTTGGGDLTNVTIQETYEILTATGVVRGGLTGVTARNWANLIVAYSATETYTITNTYHRPWNVSPQSNVVVFEVEDTANVRMDDVYLPKDVFDVLTDQQVTDYIAADLSRQTDIANAENDLETPDTVIETRAATFELDDIII